MATNIKRVKAHINDVHTRLWPHIKVAGKACDDAEIGIHNRLADNMFTMLKAEVQDDIRARMCRS